MKCFLEERGKISSVKTQRKRFFGRNEALVFYRTAEEERTALADIDVYEGWTVEIYRSYTKDDQIRVNYGYREEQNKAVEKSQQIERQNTNTKEDNVTPSTKEEIENLKRKI